MVKPRSNTKTNIQIYILINSLRAAKRSRARLNKLEAQLIEKGIFSGKIYFQHGNAKQHVKKKTTSAGSCLPHPPYSPNLPLFYD